jgi:Na+-transporting methylmalonyl-CoA/oxaloacetate decarboxylase gamma subunit
MKMSHKFLVLFLLALALSGCSSCPCKKKATETPAPETVRAVAVPVAPEVVQESAPAMPAAPAEEKIPAAVQK